MSGDRGRATGDDHPADPDRVDSLDDGPEVERTVHGSRFIGQALRADDEAEAGRRLDPLRRRYHDATHHCWAFRLEGTAPGRGVGEAPGILERWSDDGEPSGSAGTPILGALQREGRVGALVAVTRYFGGTKLGTGGLVRAYGDAARAAVAAAPPRILWRTRVLEVRCAFDQLGTVESVLAKGGEVVHSVERSFQPEPRFRVELRRSRAESLAAALVEAAAGQVELRWL